MSRRQSVNKFAFWLAQSLEDDETWFHDEFPCVVDFSCVSKLLATFDVLQASEATNEVAFSIR
jgi:hypothetical protein